MAEALKGARVLVTGATGFLGRHVSALLSAVGAQPIPVGRSAFDLTHEAGALAALLMARPDIVVHLAAPRDEAPPTAAVRDPILMGLNVLGACALARAKAVMVCRDGPKGSPRHAVRQALMAAARAHRREHGLRFVQIVPCEMYGPSDRLAPGRLRLVPSVVAEVLDARSKTRTAQLPGNGKRPFPLLYVEDAARAVVLACGLPGCDEPLEVSGPETLRIEEIAAIAARSAGFKGDVEWNPQIDPWQPAVQDGIGVVREVLDWEPATKVEHGMMATVEACAVPAGAVPAVRREGA